MHAYITPPQENGSVTDLTTQVYPTKYNGLPTDRA